MVQIRIALIVCLIGYLNPFYSQTPGMIVQPATGSGPAILDPNGDGYISQTTNGFITDDQLESELPFSSLIFPGTEPIGDINNGPNCGFTDFVDQGDRDPAQKYLSPAGNWLFRLRLGGIAPNAKSYSILIDTDGLFGNTGPLADPNYTLNNPGFEIEIVLATHFGVFVYDVSNTTPNCTPVISYPGTTNFQKSIAGSTNCNDPDYFYDFYVVFAQLASQFGITTSTLMRYVIVDNMAAQASTVCQPNSASDVGGVGNCPNLATCFQNIINYQGLCSPNTANCLARSTCPMINSPINSGATSVSGTSVEANGTTIRVYKNSVLIGTTTVSGGVWTLSSISPALASNDVITATAEAANEYVSESICDPTTVGSTCTNPPLAAQLSTISGNKGIRITLTAGTLAAGSLIYMYNPDGTLFNPSVLLAGSVNPITTVAGTNVYNFECQTGQCFPSGTYYISFQQPGQCESSQTPYCFNTATTTQIPTVTTSPILSTSTSISGTIPAPDNVSGVSVNVYVNGFIQAIATSSAGGAWTATGLTLNPCDTIRVQASGSGKCYSALSTNYYVSGGTTATPSITGNYCTSTTISSVTGVSSEANGTSITLFINGVSTTSTTLSNGAFTFTGLSLTPGTSVYVRATAACKAVSANSNTISITALSSNTGLSLTTNPVVAESTSLTGTGTNGNTVQVLIDGYPVGSPVSVASGVWNLTGIQSYELYPNGILTLTTTSGANCASNPVSAGVVVCLSPQINLNVSPDTILYCGSSTSASVTVANSQSMVIYQLTNQNGTNIGSSVLGTGSNISLGTGTLTGSGTIKVKALKLPPTCQNYQTDTIKVFINPAPTLNLTVAATNTVVCSGNGTSITISNSQLGYTYVLRNNANNMVIGSSVSGTGSTLTFPTGNLTSTTTFNVQVTGPSPTLCVGQLNQTVTVTVTSIPSAPIIGTTTQPTCATPTGSVSISNPALGTGYEYSIDNGAYQVSNSFTNISPGNHNLTVRPTGATCVSPQTSFTINAVPSLPSVPSVTLTQPTCATPTGTITFTAQAGVQYGVNGTYQAGTSFASLAPGSYTIAVRNTSDNTCITNGTAQTINAAPSCPPIASNDTGSGNEDLPLVLPSIQNNDVDSNGTVVTNTIDLDPNTPGVQTSFNSANGNWSVNPTNGNVTFTPNSNFNGTEIISYTIQDNSGLTSNTANLTAIITPVNDTPILDNESHIINEEGSASGDLTDAGDYDVDGNLVINTNPLSGPANGTIIINANGTYTYTPNTNFNGTDIIIVEICDDGSPLPSICLNDTIFITVNPVNDPPIVDNENVILNEDGTYSGDLTDLGDVDPDGTTLICAPTPGFGPFHGTITINTNGTYTYTPNANYYGNDTVVVEVCDQGLPLPGLCTYDTIFITVNPINDAPIATIDITSTFEGNPTSFSVINNDVDIDGVINSASGTIIQNGSHGSALINNGTLTYTPNAGFYGQDTVIYQICDNGMPILCDTAIVIITVEPCLNNPNADCDGDGVTNANEALNNTDPSNYCSLLLASQSVAPNAGWQAADCDGDGVTNQTELNDNTNPLNPCEYVANSQTLTTTPAYNTIDCDGDGVTNEDEIDPDGDGIPGPNGTDPQNPCSMNVASITVSIDPIWASSDCDGDGVSNGDEIDPDGDGIPGPNGTDPVNGCSLTQANQSLPPSGAWLNTDCDGDGVTNGDEIDPNGDGIPGPNGTDPLLPCNYTLSNQTVLPSLAWNTLDCDGDGATNIDEIDPDGDGTPGPNGTNPQDPCSLNLLSQTLVASQAWYNQDCDGDGVSNGAEIDPNGDGTPGPNGTDLFNSCDYNEADQTLQPDSTWYANDCDGDGVTNEDEIDPDGDGNPGPNGTNPNNPCEYNLSAQTASPSAGWLAQDCDGDGVSNGDELDPDDDGTPGPNGTDPSNPCSFTLSSQTITPSQVWIDADCDGDGVSNGIEIDSDGDGIPGPNATDPNDPCSFDILNQTLPTSANWNTLDCDGDGVTNGDEIDPDGDGIPGPNGTNLLDPCSYTVANQTITTSVLWNDSDCDGDGVPNGVEIIDLTNPQDPCDYDTSSISLPFGSAYWNADCDNDGLTNQLEDSLGTNPWDVDTDGDGLTDNEEVTGGSDPLNPCDPNPSLPSCNTGITIPEAFTPDGDNVNDYFVIVGIANFTNNKLSIFNRWGNIVYEINGYQNQWNGNANGSMIVGSEPLPTGTYYYILDLYGDGTIIHKGSIYLKR